MIGTKLAGPGTPELLRLQGDSPTGSDTWKAFGNYSWTRSMKDLKQLVDKWKHLMDH